MQFLGKLINQTLENDKKTKFAWDFGLLGPNFGLQNIFAGFTSTTSSLKLFQAIILCRLKEN